MISCRQILSIAVLFLFILLLVSASFARANFRPSGVYQRGRAQAGHRAGFGRAAARNFKSGLLAAKNSGPSKLKRYLYRYMASVAEDTNGDCIARSSERSFGVAQTFILELLPVLNL